jgi:phosphinothricin acetyltransferase
MASLEHPAARPRPSPFPSPHLQSMPLLIRLATERDLEAINAIYNHYVPVSTTTYDVAPMSPEERRKWFAGRQEIHPVTVACQSHTIVGWGSLHPFRGKSGYRFTVENSVYVHPNHQRQGIGSALLADQIERARQLKIHAIVAGIDALQDASLRLHAKHGFVEVARFPQIGWKFDQWLDVVFMQLTL